jgi:hypothetical protein
LARRWYQLALQLLEFGHQLLFGLGMVGIDEDAIDRTDLNTLWLVVVSLALGALVGIDDIDLIPLGDGAVGALRFANIAVNTFVGNQ